MSFLGKLFNSNKKDTTYNGPKPYQHFDEATGGKQYYQAILDKLAGRNVGYGDEYVSYANPQVANLRNTFNSSTLPELKSELTATGRRAGSSGFKQLEDAYTKQAFNENDIVAQLAQRNAEARREDMNQAESDLGNYALTDSNMMKDSANFEYADHNRQVNEATARRDKEAQGYQQLVGAASNALTAGFGGIPSLPKSSPSLNYGGVNYATSQPPAGYDYRNLQTARLAQRNGQRGGY